MTDASGLHVGIVGGSITGCATAIALVSAGHRVEVFERSTGHLRDRGAGIATPPSVIAAFRARGMIDAALPVLHAWRAAHVGRAGEERFGRAGWVAPLSIDLLNWVDLHRSLRERVAPEAYHTGREVTGAEPVGRSRVALQFAEGPAEHLDLVVFADGYRSLGRRLVCPGTPLEYRGYVLWRGVIDEGRLGDATPLDGVLQRVGYDGGHMVVSLVPGPGGALAPGTRRISWACCLRVPRPDLGALLVDRHGRAHEGALPPGTMRPELERQLKARVGPLVPPFHADIVEASRDTFVQAAFTAEVPRYRDGRICLAGDAGTVVPPFTASGVFKGMQNAVRLGEALAGPGDLDAALAAWDTEATAAGRQLAALGHRLEQGLVWDVPDFAHTGAAVLEEWWAEAAKLPEDLFPTPPPVA